MEYVSVLIQHHSGQTGDVLICKNADGVWEFPNDRVRTNETEPEAAVRLAWEQLGMEITPGIELMIGHKLTKNGVVEYIREGNITHDTHQKHDYRHYYSAINKWQVEPKGDKYTEYKWVHPSELGEYEFEGDDKNFMAKFDKWVNPSSIPDVRML